jgi:acetoacetyl-CoA synthetase
VPNSIETLVAFLATASLGAVWSSCSPDFGSRAVLDRFTQIEPTVLVAVDGYRYNGRAFDVRETVAALQKALPTLRATVLVPHLDPGAALEGTVPWAELTATAAPLEFTLVPFDQPLWVLYSSGTTGLPKGIVQSHGGIVVEHLKALALQYDLGPGDRFLWFTTTGWMMWNFLVGGLLVGSTVVLYDGSPGHPDLDVLWAAVERHQVGVFGTSAPFLQTCQKAGLVPGERHDLSGVRTLGSTGSPLAPEQFAWIAESVGAHVQISSMSGGTDVCTAFIASAPTVPVWLGELSCAALGADIHAVDEKGDDVPLSNDPADVGELVINQPMPSMPVALWADPDGSRLREAYFADFPGRWRHGDWLRATPRGSFVISGRSDSTLNRGGVRMGTADLYAVIEGFDEVVDSLVIDTTALGSTEEGALVCFLVLADGASLVDVEPSLRTALRKELSPRHVPDRFVLVDEVPRTLSGKKCEVPVKRILAGVDPEKAVSRGALKNPEALAPFLEMAGRA